MLLQIHLPVFKNLSAPILTVFSDQIRAFSEMIETIDCVSVAICFVILCSPNPMT